MLDTEIVPVGEHNRTDLCNRLRRYILTHRDSNDAAELVAVASGIRKLVACLPPEDLGSLAELLEPAPRMSVPLEVELEVAKTISRRLAEQPPNHDDAEPALADRLLDLAIAYLNVRLLPREKYGATALNAVLALLLLRSRHVPRLLEKLESLGAQWFVELTVRRCRRIIDDLRTRLSPERLAEATHALGEVVGRLEVVVE